MHLSYKQVRVAKSECMEDGYGWKQEFIRTAVYDSMLWGLPRQNSSDDAQSIFSRLLMFCMRGWTQWRERLYICSTQCGSTLCSSPLCSTLNLPQGESFSLSCADWQRSWNSIVTASIAKLEDPEWILLFSYFSYSWWKRNKEFDDKRVKFTALCCGFGSCMLCLLVMLQRNFFFLNIWQASSMHGPLLVSFLCLSGGCLGNTWRTE